MDQIMEESLGEAKRVRPTRTRGRGIKRKTTLSPATRRLPPSTRGPGRGGGS